MDDGVLAFIGAILQVLGLMAAFGNLAVGVVALVLQALPKDAPRSSREDEPRHH